MKLGIPARANEVHKSLKDFEMRKKVGEGAFSEVFHAFSSKLNSDVALKIISMPKLTPDDQWMVSNEVKIHSNLRHPRIASLLDYFIEDDKVVLVLEYLPNGNLFTRMRTLKKLPEEEIERYLKQTAEGLYYLHSLGVFYRDLKPENLLLDSENNLKICDFGWATTMADPAFRSAKAGTLTYMSPEALIGFPQDSRSDMWALGVLIYEMFFNREPFQAANQEELMQKIDSNNIDFSKPLVPLPTVYIELVKGLLSVKPSERPTAQQILSLNLPFNKQEKALTTSPDSKHLLSQIQLSESIQLPTNNPILSNANLISTPDNQSTTKKLSDNPSLTPSPNKPGSEMVESLILPTPQNQNPNYPYQNNNIQNLPILAPIGYPLYQTHPMYPPQFNQPVYNMFPVYQNIQPQPYNYQTPNGLYLPIPYISPYQYQPNQNYDPFAPQNSVGLSPNNQQLYLPVPPLMNHFYPQPFATQMGSVQNR